MATVLVASGDAALMERFEAEMEAENFQVVCACNGQDAYAAALDEQVDAALLDVRLDIFDGFEVARMLRADPELPASLAIVLLTDEAPNPRVFEKCGATAHFPKQHLAADLRELLTSLVTG